MIFIIKYNKGKLIAFSVSLLYNINMKIWKKKIIDNDEIHSKLRLKQKIGLALSGGGARGFAHIGAIKAFCEAGIEFDYVSGTSAGSIIGAGYCAGLSAHQMQEFAYTLTEKEIRNSSILFIPSKSSNIEQVVSRLLPVKDFSEMKIPFCAVAVDLITGEEVHLTSGLVAKAVSASCAVPLVFTPVKIDEYTLIDGGVLNTIPADTLRTMGAEFVVSVDINHTRGEGTQSLKLIDTLQATWRIIMKSTAFKGTLNTDVLIEPELQKFSSLKLASIDDMIDEGYRATKEKIPEILELIGVKGK
ncbi:MAG: patatin-like phospholipase family protein [Clostridia bacterium]